MPLVLNDSARIVGLPIVRLNKDKKPEFVSDTVCLVPTIKTKVDELTWEHSKKDKTVQAMIKKGELLEVDASEVQSTDDLAAELLAAAGK